MFFRIFHGNWRGPGQKEDKTIFANIGVEFRRYLHHFKGAKLHVFMCIVLHMNEDGVSGPSYDLIAQETGYSRGAVGKALAELCDDTAIEGHPVLIRWRERDDKGKYVGANQYKIFPTDEEIQSTENPPVDKPTVGESRPEEEPSSKHEPDGKEKPSPKGEAPPPEKKPEKVTSSHPAIKAFREAAARFPAKSWWQDVARIVGDDNVSIQKWGGIVKEWVGKGFNPVNVKGMLDVFKHGWEGEQPTNGHRLTWEDLAADQSDPEPKPERPPLPGDPIWQTTYGDLQLQLPRETFNTWLRNARLVGQEGDTYVIGVDNVYAREWLEHRLKQVVVDTLSRVAGKPCDVRFELLGQETPADQMEVEAEAFRERHGIEAAPRKPGEPDRHLGTPAPKLAGQKEIA